jgi:hypothetical protein
MTANEEDQVPGFTLGTSDEIDKAGGVHRAPRRIEKDFTRGRVFGKQIEAIGDDLAHLAIGIAAGPLQELGCDGIRVRIARLADVIKDQSCSLPMD